MVIRLYHHANSYGTQKFSFPLRAIIIAMEDFYRHAKATYHWLMGTGDFYTAMTNFLRTRYCFRQNNASECQISIQLWACLVNKHGAMCEDERDAVDVRVAGDVLASPHRLQYYHDMCGKLRTVFEPPLLDAAYREYPSRVEMQYCGLDGLDLAVAVVKNFPNQVRYEQIFRGRLISSHHATDPLLSIRPPLSTFEFTIEQPRPMQFHPFGFHHRGVLDGRNFALPADSHFDEELHAEQRTPTPRSYLQEIDPDATFSRSLDIDQPAKVSDVTIDQDNAANTSQGDAEDLRLQIEIMRNETTVIKMQQDEILNTLRQLVMAQTPKGRKRFSSSTSANTSSGGHISKKV